MLPFFLYIFDSDAVSPLFILMPFVAQLAYLYYLGDLVSMTNKSPFNWVLGAMFFPLGTVATFYLLKAHAIENGWEGWGIGNKGRFIKGEIMKYIAILLNFVLICLAVFILCEEGFPNNTFNSFVFFSFLCAPIASLIVILGSNDKSLIGLYFKRKALEEQKKIEQLQGE